MAVNKNFVIKHGVEVSDNLIYANPDVDRVGIGTTVLNYTLEVNGGIGATNLNVSGIATITTLVATALTVSSLNIGAISNPTVAFSTVTATNAIPTNLDLTSSTISIGGTVGSNGQYLISTGSGVNWISTPTARTSTTIIAAPAQTSISYTYTVGLVDVYINGVKLAPTEFTANDGVSITLNQACFGGESIEVIAYAVSSLGAGTSGIQGITIQNQGITTGTPLSITSLNFVGASVTAINSGVGVTVYISDNNNTTYSSSAGIATVAQDLTGTPNITVGTIDGSSLNISGLSTFAGITTVTGTTLFSKQLNISGIATVRQLSDYKALVGAASSTTETFVVTVASKTANHRYFGTGSASGYYIDDKESPFITLLPGKTYRFDQANASNATHQLRFYLEADKTTQYTTNVTFNGTAGSAGAYTEIIVTDTTPIVLHYQCVNHGYMGNSVQTNSNFINTPYSINTIGGLSVSGVTTSGTLNIGTGGTVITTTSAGLVGIGTTNPGEKLQVDGNIRVGISTTSNYITFYGTYKDGPLNVGTELPYQHTYIGERIYDYSGPEAERSELLLFKGNDTAGVAGPDRIRLFAGEHRFDVLGFNTTGTFEQVGVSTAAVNKLTITSTGVGIGTTNATSALTVKGNTSLETLNVSGISTFSGNVRVGVDTSSGVILTSPNGTQYRLIVDDSGTLSTVAV